MHSNDFSYYHDFGTKADPNAPIFLFDMDGVLVDLEGWMYEQWMERFPTEPLVPPEDRKSFYFSDDHPESYHDRLRALMCEKGSFIEPKPIEGAIEAVRTIAVFGEVFFLTAPMYSAPNCMAEKVAWIDREFGGESWTHRIIITKDKTTVRGNILFDDREEVHGRLHPEWEHIVVGNATNKGAKGRRIDGWDQGIALVQREYPVRGSM